MSTATPQLDLPAADSGGVPTVHHVPARKRRGVRESRMTVNLGPMIDVIFNLLIYFVVTASFSVEEGVLTLKLPQGSGAPEQSLAPPDQPLEITLRSAQARIGPGVAIVLQNQPFRGDFGELAAQLTSMQFNDHNPAGLYKADNPVLIRPEGEVRWQYVVDAFNAAVAARYTNVSFAQAQGAGGD